MRRPGRWPSASMGGQHGLLDYFVRHPTAPHILLLLMVIAGLYAVTQIRSQFFPDIVRNVVNVSVVWSGAGPEEIDEGIIARLEPRLRAAVHSHGLRPCCSAIG